MRKLNNRAVFFICSAMMFGVVLSSYSLLKNILAVVAIFLMFVSCVYFLIERKNSVPRLITCGLMLGFFIFGILLGHFSTAIYNHQYRQVGGEITCEITEISNSRIIAKDINVDGEKVKGKVLIKYSNADKFEVGDVITFDSSLSPIKIFEDGQLNFYYSSGVTYRAYPETVAESHHTFTLRNYIVSLIYKVQEKMFEENAGIAYAMTFGDSSLVDFTALTLLRRGGVAHIFAVSGLHIGLLYGVLKMFSWIRLRSPLKEKNAFNFLCIAVLLFYVYLCDFTASSMRAFLMILSSIVLTRLGLTRDRLTIIALPTFILMLYSPYIIFTIGFQLSFLTVLGLAILPSKLEKYFKFMRYPKLYKSVAFGLSAFLSTMIVSCYHFGYISTISVLLNLLIVPLYSLIYVINLCGLLIYGIFSAFGMDKIVEVMCPFFTSKIYDLTVGAFSAVDSLVPLAFYMTIPACVVIAFHGVTYANSILVSDQINKKKKLILCSVFAFAVCLPTAVSYAQTANTNIEFYITQSQVMTVEIRDETIVFCKSGGDVDLSNLNTEKVNVVVFDNYYKKIRVNGSENHEITLYAKFYGEEPKGVCSIPDFNKKYKEIQMVEYATIKYNDVLFKLDGKTIKVTDENGTREISDGETAYYARKGIFRAENEVKAER